MYSFKYIIGIIYSTSNNYNIRHIIITNIINNRKITTNTAKITTNWTINGDNIYYDDGDVGIGKINPATLLHIVGTAGIQTIESTDATGSSRINFVTTTNWDWEVGGRGLNATLPGCFYIYNSIGTGDEKYKLIITQSGHVGIGETNPTVPLDIAGWNASFPLGSNQTGPYIGTDSNNKQWFGFPDTGQSDFRVIHSSSAAGNDNISIRAAGTIWSKRRFLVHSDRRIKTEIEHVNNTEALDIVNKIPCRKYYYSDPERQMSLNKTIGFIAQEVKEHLPQAITIGTDMVFDEKLCIENPIWNGNILTIEGLVFTDNHTGKCRFEVRDGESEIGETIILTVNDDKKTFTFEKPWKQLILLTKEVNDFHALDKAKIFALHHAALQEVDRQLWKQRLRI